MRRLSGCDGWLTQRYSRFYDARQSARAPSPFYSAPPSSEPGTGALAWRASHPDWPAPLTGTFVQKMPSLRLSTVLSRNKFFASFYCLLGAKKHILRQFMLHLEHKIKSLNHLFMLFSHCYSFTSTASAWHTAGKRRSEKFFILHLSSDFSLLAGKWAKSEQSHETSRTEK